MNWRNDKNVYGAIAKSFHWIMAIAIIVMLAVGLYMVELPTNPDKFKIYGIHKSVGMIILLLVLLRIAWRFINIQPSLPGNIPPIQRLASHMVHFFLYGLMIAMPLSGWVMSSSAGFPVSVFGWFTAPDLVEADKAISATSKLLHKFGALAFIGFITLHIGAALYHHFIRKDDILRRILPWAK